MEIKTLLKQFAPAIAAVGITAVVCGGVAGLVFRFAFPQEYSSEIKILVIQKYTLTDSYTASKSAEKVSQNLAEVVKTSSFLEDVIESKRVDLSSLLRKGEADRRTAWEHTLDTEVIAGASILQVTAYDTNPSHAEQIVNAVANVLIEQGSEYHGAPDTITLKVVDTALTSNYPQRPNVLLNGAAAAVFGAVCAAVVLFLRSPHVSKQSVQSFVQARATKPIVHAKPGVQVHAGPGAEADSASQAAQPQQYSVLHVANFHKHLPNAQPGHGQHTSAQSHGDVKTLPVRHE